MKTLLLSFFLIGAAYSLNAQQIITISLRDVQRETLDSAYLKCSYTLHFVEDAAKPENVATEEMALLIGRKITGFFSYTRFQLDSLMSTMSPEQRRATMSGNSDRQRTGRFTYELFKNYPEGQITTTDRIAVSVYKYEEPYELPEWEILPETKIILGYSCQKATTTFRGRDYIAWFTIDIPISNGPWKFAGLPGLILNVADTRNHYVFECSGIETPKEKPPITMRKENYVRVTKRDFNRVYERFIKDPVGFVVSASASNVQVVTRSADGSTSSTPPTIPYNPIELIP